MNLDIYLDTSSRWLIDVTSTFDLAESLSKAMRHDYQIPKVPSWDSGPFITSVKGREVLQAALPLILKTSIESAKSAELALGRNHQPDDLGRTLVPSVSGNGPRVNAVLARAGIIAQFELWKCYARFVGYPINKKQAGKYMFSCDEERAALLEVVELRNSLTHEVNMANDPNMRQLVEYSYTCQYLARQAARAANSSFKADGPDVPHP